MALYSFIRRIMPEEPSQSETADIKELRHRFEVYRINAYWIFSTLGISTVLIFVYKFSDQQQVVDNINFASTIAGLILAILAIVYSYLGNSSLSKDLTKVQDAAREISNSQESLKSASNQIIDVSSNLKAVFEQVRLHSEQLGDIQKNLIGMRSQLGPGLSNVDPQTEQLLLDDTRAEKIALAISPYTFITMYALRNAFVANKKKVNIKNLMKIIANNSENESSLESYILGAVTSFNAVGLHNIIWIGEDFIVNNFNDMFSKYLTSEKFTESHGENSAYLQSNLNTLHKVDSSISEFASSQ